MGLLVNIREEYEIKSNREAGIGRYDLSIMKRDRSKGAIFEFKKIYKGEKLEEKAKEALNQIEKKEYIKEFEGVEVKKIGIAFKGKNALVLFGN